MSQAATTRWSLVLAARGSEPGALKALSSLCEDYRPVVLSWFRRNAGAERAEDASQNFFVHVLESGLFQRADSARGSFRAFLHASLRNHWREAQRGELALKRQANLVHDDEALDRVADDAAGPDRQFDRDWALQVLARALTALEAEAGRAGKSELYAAVRPYLVDAPEAGDFVRVGAVLGMPSNSVAVAVRRLRERMRALARIELASTLPDGGDIDAEMRWLREALLNS